jgi:hypothetical protein
VDLVGSHVRWKRPCLPTIPMLHAPDDTQALPEHQALTNHCILCR